MTGKNHTAGDLEAKEAKFKEGLKEANNCMLIGAGVGAAGILGALAAGAVCPLCVIAAPGLIGAGLIKRIYTKRKLKTEAIVQVTGEGDGNVRR
ncbi:MAG: hypothetical protein GYA55_10845 [SAR324 cluster bacterium]|uniref:Uncharacterized protein n=1 Tax=SAR324 cluster bacterium TaxID=2024889 RepID=A0A7X9FSR7_9DELT|nr:hypothetical protein [SAR324 cluster bacterium]